MATTGATEKIEIDVEVDASKASREVAKLTGDVGVFDTAAQKLWRSLSTVEGKTLSLGEQAKALQQKLGPAAAAISGVSAALGDQAGQAGKVIAATGQLVAAYAAGGPFGVAIAAGTLAVDQLTKAWEREIKTQDDALKAQFAGIDAASATRNTIRGRIDALKSDITAESGGSKGQSIFEIKERYAVEIKAQQLIVDTLMQRTNLHDNLTDQEYAQQKIAEENLRNLKEAQALEIALYKLRRDGNKFAPKTGGGSQGSGSKLTPAQMAAFRASRGGNLIAEAESGQASFLAGFGLSGGVAGSGTQGAPKFGTAIDAMSGEIAALSHAMEVNKAIAEDWGLAVSKAFEGLADSSTVAQQAVGIVVGASQSLLNDMITGQENALASFTSAIMAQAGQALVSYGIQAIGKGVLYAADPLTAALAPSNFAVGAGLIAAGVGLGGVATGINHVAAGGVIGQALPDKGARTSSGVNRGSGGRPSGGASAINVTVIYAGASGPTAEQGSRAVVDAIDRANRRGMN